MATLDHILRFTTLAPVKQTIADSAAGAAIEIGQNQAFSIISTGAFHLISGGSAVAAPDAGADLFPGSTKHVMDLADNATYIRVFNDSGGSIDIYVKLVSRF